MNLKIVFRAKKLFFILCLSLAFACSHNKKNLNGPDIAYLESAEKNFLAGETLFTKKKWEEAIAYYEHVQSKYPYTNFAALSDLRIADAHYVQQKWFDAALSYEFFVKFHPQHESVPYAMYRVAECHYKDMPTEFFLFPKGYKRDQKPVLDALDSLDAFLNAYPDDVHANDAKKMKIMLLEKMAKHDFFVATFYKNRKKWAGAVGRFERLAELYPETTTAPQALFEAAILADTKLRDKDRAAKNYQALIDLFPETKLAKDAAIKLSLVERG